MPTAHRSPPSAVPVDPSIRRPFIGGWRAIPATSRLHAPFFRPPHSFPIQVGLLINWEATNGRFRRMIYTQHLFTAFRDHFVPAVGCLTFKGSQFPPSFGSLGALNYELSRVYSEGG